MTEFSRVFTPPHHHQLRLLVENYRRARNRATLVRADHSRIDLDGRYHLDGVVPHSVREHSSLHEEKHAAVVLADSLVRWIDGHP